MTLKDDLIGCIVIDVGLDGVDGDVIGLTLSGTNGRQYVTEHNSGGYMDIELVFG